MSFIKSPSHSQRNSTEERVATPCNKDTGSVLAAVAAQLGQGAAPPGPSLELASSWQGVRQHAGAPSCSGSYPLLTRVMATGVACNVPGSSASGWACPT